MVLKRLSKNFIYHDLKAENVLIGDDGFPRLSDFGLAEDAPLPGKTSFASWVRGQIETTSPEMLKNEGYTEQVDWWSLGILTYQLYFGQ